VFQLQQNESRGSDLRNTAGVEADPAEGLLCGLEQGVRSFADSVDAADDLVEDLLVLGEFTALGLLDWDPESFGCSLLAQVSQSEQALPDGGGQHF
jgi:hypothetical protein